MIRDKRFYNRLKSKNVLNLESGQGLTDFSGISTCVSRVSDQEPITRSLRCDVPLSQPFPLKNYF